MSKEITVRDLFEKFKSCKDVDFRQVQSYDSCIKTGKLFTKHLNESYKLYDDSIEAVSWSIKRLKVEKAYKITLTQDEKETDNGVNVIDYLTQLRFLRDKDVSSWQTLDKLTLVESNKDLSVYNPRDLSNFPIFSVLTLIIFLLVVQFIHSFFSGRIFKLKLINQLETLEQTDLSEFLKKEIEVEKNTYTIVDRIIFKKKNMEKLTINEKILIKNINRNKHLIDEAYRKYMTPAENLSEEEIGQIQEEIRIILREFYEKIGFNLDENTQNLPFNDDEEKQ